MRNKCILIFAALIFLVALSVNPVAAELMIIRSAKGNNVGLGVRADWASGGPFKSWPGNPNTNQFPKGSGNMIYNDGWGFGVMATQDLDGDGAAEDTTAPGGGGRSVFPFMCSMDSYDMLAEVAASGALMEIAAAGRDGSMRSRVWSSLDDAELAAWPTEGREGHSPSGAPVLHGTETMYMSSGDVFCGFGAPLSGFHLGYNLYFLDFGQSNNMVYSHLYIQNVSEYMTWNHLYGSEMWNGSPAPSGGWTWNTMMLYQNWRQIGFSKTGGMGWAYHPAQGIHTLWSKAPQVASWTPQDPPLFGMKVLKNMEHNGQQAELLGVNVNSGTEFGFSGSGNLMAQGWANSKIYRSVMNVEGNFAGQTSPFTGEQVRDLWPGKLTPEDDRYDQWLWGGAGHWNHYTYWGELHDIAPRDTLSFDWVLMFSPTGVTPLVAPKFDIANIDDPMMQEAFSPQEEYAAVAQTVFDGGYQTPATPIAPALTIIPGDRQVTITWSDINLKTPDPYYAFLQANGLDPENRYREMDFEGFRLYRSFVGPNDSHSEVIWESSIAAGNVEFFYIDRLDDDYPLRRMRNGLKVWYALVPFDKNYDEATGDEFSLPDPSAGKTWNRAGEAGLYNVISRSDASEFKEASFSSVSYEGPATNPLATIELAGDGTGNLIEAPQWLTPAVGNVTLNAVNNEKITSDKTVYVECASWWHNGGGCSSRRPYGTRQMKLVEGSNETFAGKQLVGRAGDVQTVSFFDTPAADGISISLDVDFEGLTYPAIYRNPFVHNIDVGSYPGTIEVLSTQKCRPTKYIGAAPSFSPIIRNGRFTVTWKSTSTGGTTVEIQDITRGTGVPATPYQDELGWGFMTPEGYGDEIAATRVNGTYYDEAFRYRVPKEERTALMESELPAGYSERFALWINGMAWIVQDGMPADGTVMTIDNAWGTWNADQTVFTQVADFPWPGDKWKVEIKPMSMDPEDADLNKIKVVPNPYIASSFLDLSSTQRRIEFINLPASCTVRIYSLGGNLVNVLNHIGINRSGWGDFTDLDRLSQGVPKELTGYDNHGGTEAWNLRNRFGQTVASGLYFYHVTDIRGETFTGKFYVVN